jgi:hypothetical protein
LHRPPERIAISDPAGAWRRFWRKRGKSEAILDELRKWRGKVRRGAEVPGLDEAPGYRGDGHVDTWAEGGRKTKVSYDVTSGFWLGLKNPEIFLEHLDIFLAQGLRCVVSVRHPVPVINSWVWHPRGGVMALPEGERDRALAGDGRKVFGAGRSLVFSSAERSVEERRIALYNHLTSKILDHQGDPNLMIIRHEDWFREPEALLCEVESFIGMEPSGELVLEPVQSQLRIGLSAREVELISERCVRAGELGYPMSGGRLA